MDCFLVIIIGAIIILLIWLIIIKLRKPKIDWNRYLGAWHEIARLPVPYENGCNNAMAHYSMNNDGSIRVVNSCVIDGKTVEIKGTAKIVSSNKLSIKFDNNPVEGDYTVFHVDYGYQNALVGSADRQSLWILSRSPSIDPLVYQQMVGLAEELGFNTTKLITNKN